MNEQKQQSPHEILPAGLRIMMHPVRLVTRFLHSHYHRRYAGKYRHPEYLFGLDCVLVAIIMVLLGTFGYFFFLRETLASKMNIMVEARPHEIISGDRITFTITYENRSKESIHDAVVSVRLPSHFIFLQSYPKEFNTETHALSVGTLPPGGQGQTKISGILWAEVGKPTTLFTSLAFISGKGRRDMKTVRSEFPVTDSVLQGTIELPDRLITEQNTSFTVRFKNNGSHPIPNLHIIPDWPGFTTFLASKPAMSEGQWKINELAPDAEQKISGTARISSRGNEVNLNFKPFLKFDDTDLYQKTFTAKRSLIASPLQIELTVDPQTSVVTPLETLTARIAYANLNTNVIHDVRIGIETKNPFIDPAALPPSAVIPQLESGAHGTLEFKIPIKKQPSGAIDERSKNLTLVIRGRGTGFLIDGAPLTLDVTTSEVTRSIITPFFGTAMARYWTAEGDQIGRGPIPPLTDETTKYWIFWKLEPTTNDIAHLEFRGTLPPHVAWSDKSNVTIGSPVVYNAETRIVTWTIDELPATWISRQTVGARFEVALTPARDDVGKIPTILEETVVTGRDLFTDMALEKRTDRITTALPADRRAAGKGRVEE